MCCVINIKTKSSGNFKSIYKIYDGLLASFNY